MATPTKNDTTSIQDEHNDQNHDFPELYAITETLHRNKGAEPKRTAFPSSNGNQQPFEEENTINLMT